MISFTSTDRILILAPHPDDESLATGGLIQQARAAGAKVWVVFATDGDNNLWAQRVIERRLLVSDHDRAKWGARRRQESRRALQRLGVEWSDVVSLGLPDQGLTALLLRGGESVLGTLRMIYDLRRPTLLVLPSADDSHPDHSSLHVLARIALDALPAESVRILEYVVHRSRAHAPQEKLPVDLRASEQSAKREAILCHETQVLLSRRRFTAYARPTEEFQIPAEPGEESAVHPIRRAWFDRYALRLIIAPYGRAQRGRKLSIVMESLTHGSIRWSLPLPKRSGWEHLRDETTGAILRRATLRVQRGIAEVCIPITGLRPLSHAFVKLTHRPLFFDAWGWRGVPVDSAASMFPKPALVRNFPPQDRLTRDSRA
jgi:LmbE family N-acetylglucosaminyl deacetylase